MGANGSAERSIPGEPWWKALLLGACGACMGDAIKLCNSERKRRQLVVRSRDLHKRDVSEHKARVFSCRNELSTVHCRIRHIPAKYSEACISTIQKMHSLLKDQLDKRPPTIAERMP
jgi:hypothetical protein